MRCSAILCAVALLAGCGGRSSSLFAVSTGGGGGSTKLAFRVQPSTTAAGLIISPAIQVAAQTPAGTVDTAFKAAVSVAIGTKPAAGTLSGTTTVTATAGVATFSDLSISTAGNGYTLTASTSGLTSATSASFNITP